MSAPEGATELRWAAWRVEEDGAVRAMLTFDAGGELEREEVSFASLAEAEERLGDGFRDVVERAVSEGHRQGRWRP